MFTCKRKVFLRETDATGVIYFTSLFHYALEALENFLHQRGVSLSVLFKKGYAFPIVHAEVDIKAPLRVDEEIEIELRLGEIGTSSFSLETVLQKKTSHLFVGRTKVVHVFLDEKKEKAPLPEDFITLLQELR